MAESGGVQEGGQVENVVQDGSTLRQLLLDEPKEAEQQEAEESTFKRVYKAIVRFFSDQSKTDYLGAEASDIDSSEENESRDHISNDEIGVRERAIERSRSYSIVDEVDTFNGFAMRSHYSLRSSLKKKRNAVLLNEGNHQLIFEPYRSRHPLSDASDPSQRVSQIEVKKATRYGNGVFLLKLVYSYIAFVLCGFCFAFALILMLQYTLGVFLAGVTSPPDKSSSNPIREREAAILTLLSIPVILQTLALLINLFTGFLRDGWNDFDFLNTLTFLPRLVREWVTTAGMILIPLSVCAISLLSRSSNPWENTLLAAFWCTLAFYLLYAALVFILQISSCIDLVSQKGELSIVRCLGKIFYLRLLRVFSIKKNVLLRSNEKEELEDSIPSFLRFGYTLTRERVYDYDRFGKVIPHATEDGHSLLYMCCLLNRRMKGRMSYNNLLSSGACAIISVLLFWLLGVGYFVYSDVFDVWLTILFSFLLGVFIVITCLYYTMGLRAAIIEQVKERANRKLLKRTIPEASGASGNPFAESLDEANYHSLESRESALSEFAIDYEEVTTINSYESFIVAKPHIALAIFFGSLVMLIFFLLPLYGFYLLGVRGYEYMFVGASAFVFIQFFFNVRSLVEILGPTAYNQLEQMYTDRADRGLKARRAYMLITQLFKPERGYFWLILLTLALSFALFLAAASLSINNLATGYKGFELLGNASHRTHVVIPPLSKERGFQYPACDYDPESIPHGIAKLNFGLLDFAFFSDLAYADINETQVQLDRWFGEDLVKFINESDYPKSLPKRHSKAVYKLFKIESSGFEEALYVLSVRGTINPLDLLTDAQIWLPALMMQFLRTLLPFGTIWNELFPRLIYYLSALEASPSSRSAYYADVINLMSAIQREEHQKLLIITGHSLGGGVAIVAGARLKIPAIAFSGPNAMLSRLKFNITTENLNKYPLNVVPERDPFPQTDDPGLIVEHIRCRAPITEGSVACHEVVRSACELQYICGSGSRPPIADCNERFDYPQAKKIGPLFEKPGHPEL